MRIIKALKYILLFAAFFTAEEPLYSQKIAEPDLSFSPRHYLCYRTDKELTVDGKLNEEAWQKAPWSETFLDVEGDKKPAPEFKTRIKMLWDNSFLYIAAELEEPNVWATLRQRDTTIYNDNNFEVFIDPDGDTQNYYEFEINALNTFWDLFMTKPYRTGGFPISAWDIRGIRTAVDVQGTINNPSDKDHGWSVEIALPMKILMQSSGLKGLPKDGDEWRVDFTRVEWGVKSKDGRYQRIDDQTSYWAWSPIGLIDFHYPDMYGYLQFSDLTAGGTEEAFIEKPEEKAKRVLRELFYKERAYYSDHGRYTRDLKDLNFQKKDIPGYEQPPIIETAADFFEISMTASDNKVRVYILSDGKTGHTLLNK